MAVRKDSCGKKIDWWPSAKTWCKPQNESCAAPDGIRAPSNAPCDGTSGSCKAKTGPCGHKNGHPREPKIKFVGLVAHFRQTIHNSKDGFIMTNVQTHETDAFQRVKKFAADHAADFPATSVGGQQFAKVVAAVPQAQGQAADQFPPKATVARPR